MTRTAWSIGAIATLAITPLYMSSAEGVSGGEDGSQSVNAAEGDASIRLDLPHGVAPGSIDSAVDRIGGLKISDIRFQSPDGVTNLASVGRAPMKNAASIAAKKIADVYNAAPSANSVSVVGHTKGAQALKDVLAKEPAFTPERLSGYKKPTTKRAEDARKIAQRGSGERSPRVVNQPTHFPDFWTGAGVLFEKSDTGVVLTSSLKWLSEGGHSPKKIPGDWAMEMGFTLYNGNLNGTRPACFGGDARKDFWAQTYADIAVFSTNMPSSAETYSDTDIYSDKCEANGTEFGVGKPQNLKPDTDYWYDVMLNKGTKSSSKVSVAATLKSNDCNDIGKKAESSCIGLNINREPPVTGSATYVNRSRNWTVPGCFVTIDGTSNSPSRMDPGVDPCEWRYDPDNRW